MRPNPPSGPMSLLRFAPLTLLALTAPTFAQSAPDAFDFDTTPHYRGSTFGGFAGWSTFTSAFGAPNTPDDPASGLSAELEQGTPGAILTSTGNIYGPSGATTFVLSAAVAAPVREVLLQTRTLALPLDPASIRLTYTEAGSVLELAPTELTTLNPAPGGSEELGVRFDLTAIPSDVTDFELLFDASGAHCSLDAVLLDVRSAASIGSTYCAAVPNSTGAVGTLTATGSPFVSDAELTLDVADLPPNVFGLYLASPTQGNTPQAGGVGTLCLGGAIGRFNADIFDSGTAGAHALDVALGSVPTPTGSVAVAPGETWNFQVWHRDGGASSNFTQAVSVTFE